MCRDLFRICFVDPSYEELPVLFHRNIVALICCLLAYDVAASEGGPMTSLSCRFILIFLVWRLLNPCKYVLQKESTVRRYVEFHHMTDEPNMTCHMSKSHPRWNFGRSNGVWFKCFQNESPGHFEYSDDDKCFH